MNDKTPVSRRDFLQRLSILGTAGLAASTVLSACGGGEKGGQEGQATQGGDNSPCADVSGLSEADVQTRTTNQYVNQTPQPERRCDNCQFYIAAEGGKPCGGCQVVKGPIDPAGWCMVWTPKQA